MKNIMKTMNKNGELVKVYSLFSMDRIGGAINDTVYMK